VHVQGQNGRSGLDEGAARRATIGASIASFALVIAGWAAVNSVIDTDVQSAISVAHDAPPPEPEIEPVAATPEPSANELGAVGAGALDGSTAPRGPAMAPQFERPPCPSATEGEIAFSAHLRRVAIAIQTLGREPGNRKSFSGLAVCHPANRVAVYRVANKKLDAAIQKIARKEKIEVQLLPSAFSLSDADKVQAYIAANRAAWAAQGIEIPEVVPQANATLEVVVTGIDPEDAVPMFKPYLKQVRLVPEGGAADR
jgi:hypothetical protein